MLNGKNWEIDCLTKCELLFPIQSGRAIARILMCNTIACPCVLIVDGQVLNEFLGTPPYRRSARRMTWPKRTDVSVFPSIYWDLPKRTDLSRYAQSEPP